jgi:hypothetical protein
MHFETARFVRVEIAGQAYFFVQWRRGGKTFVKVGPPETVVRDDIDLLELELMTR